VLLVHGDADAMLPHTLTERAAQALTNAGIETRIHIAPGVGHTIDDSGLQLAARFLLAAFDIPEPA
jgi:phospholipase/carboxylesterase